ncbi:MAG: ISAzo13 family transposase [Planctomycetes bacterium]|nr:ISAzo13 family transposase [Planctomycetota bacterium]
MDVDSLQEKYEPLSPTLNERSRRVWAATEARAIGRGGVGVVAEATGISASTVRRGLRELDSDEHPLPPDSIRRAGGGRRRIADADATLIVDLEGLIEPTVSGDPQSPLRWTSRSVRRLSRELQRLGHDVSHTLVASLLHEQGYSLQGNKKSREGTSHPDRDDQFRHISRRVRGMQRRKQPVISVDTKKKELVGDFKNQGKEWRPRGDPEIVRVHDFKIPELGKANPYGVYDLTHNAGWVSIGIDHDTAKFAVNSIRRWWTKMGRAAYPEANQLLITADSGGSNGSRNRLWKLELQTLADDTGLTITVCHFPPGTSKWNKIEHRMFSHISKNWRGKPLTSLAVIVNLIARTTTDMGLRIRCELDRRKYPKGKKVTDAEMAALNMRQDKFHGDWNYKFLPRAQD